MRTHIRTALAVLPLALALAGCGGSERGPGVASANGGATDGATSGAPASNRDEEILKYVQCLRDHGLDIKDPKPGEGIQIQSEGPEEKATADQAVRACDKQMPPDQRPEDATEERDTMLKVARCMRASGVENFPDPKPGEGIDVDHSVGSDPDFDDAWKKCNEGVGGDMDTRSHTDRGDG